MKSIKHNGEEITIGTYVGFKYDIEQSGPVVAIRSGFYGVVLTVTATEGEYAREAGGEVNIDLPLEDIF